MEAIVVGGVLGLVLGGLGWYLRQQGISLVGNLFVGAAILLLLGPGLRLAGRELVTAARRSTPPAPSEPRCAAPTEAEITRIRRACVQNGIAGLSSSARFCQCTAEGWAAARQVDRTVRFTAHGGELLVDGTLEGMGRFYREFGRCGAGSARAWVGGTCRIECHGLDCAGYCRCVADRLMSESPEEAAAAVWRQGHLWTQARNQCLRRGD